MKKMKSPSNTNPDMVAHTTVVTLEELKQALSNKQPGDFNILVTGDCHIFTRAIPSRRITDKLDEITHPDILQHTDQIVINGDLLDRRASLASEDTVDFFNFAMTLLLRCMSCNTGLVILEGTPSHDNKQPKLIKVLADHITDPSHLPITYVEDISILDLCPPALKESYPNGIPALFIPDEINDDSQTTWLRVQELLRMEGLSQVHMSFMHGMFRYQEAILTTKSHIEENYESVTRHTIAINHWHLPSAKGKIRAPGSIERMRHGEEETKGFYYITLRPDGSHTEYFVVNPDAHIFSTYDVSGLPLSKVYTLLDELSDIHPPESRIRLSFTRQDETFFALVDIKRKYPNFKMSEKLLDKEDISKIETVLTQVDTGIAIRPDTIAGLIQLRLKDTDDLVLQRILDIVQEDTDG